jgi:nucleoid-associated protein YgaU
MRTYVLLILLSCVVFLTQSVSGQELLSEKRVYADHGDYADVDNPQCHVRGQDDPTKVILGLVNGDIPSLPQAVGVIMELALPTVQRAIAGTGGDIGKLFAPNRYATCVSAAMIIPARVTNIDIKGFTDEGPCDIPNGSFHKCKAGWSAWIWAQQNNYIVGTFKNWSHDRARNATLRVYGTKPPAWPKNHTVVKGECLSKIAQITYGNQNWTKIYKANKSKIANPDLIYPSQQLTLTAP